MQYVCVYPRRQDGKVLLILKSTPEWQHGKINLVGGKIESTETTYVAAARELQEESGLRGFNFRVHGAVVGKEARDPKYLGQEWVVWFLTCDLHRDTVLEPHKTPEPCGWFPLGDALGMNSLMPNLRFILPLLETRAPDWKLTDIQDGSFRFESANWQG